MSRLPKTWRNVFAYALVSVGLLVSFQANQSHAEKVDRHTRSAVCLILQQTDSASYAEKAVGRITSEQLAASLKITASFRRELGTAPHCNPNPTGPKELEPFGRPAVGVLPKGQ